MKREALKFVLGMLPQDQSVMLEHKNGVYVMPTVKQVYKNYKIVNCAKKDLDVDKLLDELVELKNQRITLILNKFNSASPHNRYTFFREIHGNRIVYLNEKSNIVFVVNTDIHDFTYDHNQFDRAMFDRLWVATVEK